MQQPTSQSIRHVRCLVSPRFALLLFSTRVFIAVSLTTAVLSTQVIALPSAASAHSARPLSYNCGGAVRCYGMEKWYGRANGSSTQMYVVPLTCNPSQCSTDGGFVDNDMWLADESSSQCLQASYSVCWVEAGYSTYTSCPFGWPCSTSEYYFWADNRPNGGGCHEHVVGSTNAYDYYRYDQDTIQRTGTSTFMWTS
jgi:hypothetical protein